MLWLTRFNPLMDRRARLALVFGLVAAAACADRDATAPRLAATDHASLNVNPSAIASLTISPSPVESGDTVTGTITLAAPAPAGGAQIALRASEPLYATVDANVIVPEGATSKTFPVITYASPFQEFSIRITADWGAAHVSTDFFLKQVRWWRPYPSIRVVPDITTFAAQAVGTTSPPQVVAVRNIGTGPLVVGVITTAGPFTQTNNCTAPVPPGGSCDVSVRYTPTGAGLQSGRLFVPGNSQGVPPLAILNGTGFVPTPVIGLSSTSITFATRPVGTSTPAKTVTITNTGNGPLVISSLTLGGANPGDFWIVANGCSGVSLNPGASCSASLVFEPTRTGARNATLTIAHNAGGGSSVVTLSGTGSKSGGGYIP